MHARTILAGTLLLGCATLAAAAPADDERLCQRVLALANDGALDAAFVPAVPAANIADDLEQSFRNDGYAGVSAMFNIARGDGTTMTLLALNSGGTCHATELAFADGVVVSFDPLVDGEESFGLDVRPLQVDGNTLALAYHGDRWRFEPLALARLVAGASVPLCRFAVTGDVRRVPAGTGSDDDACAAVRDERVQEVEWLDVEEEADRPEAPLPLDAVSRAELDWFGDGTPVPTWRLTYESGAGCGMTYRFLALAEAEGETPAIDTASAAGAALFPATSGEFLPHGAWWLDGVFAFNDRTWFAGQPQWGKTTRGDYAVYRVDPDGVHVQCRYRYLPQFRIETRAY